MGFIRCLFNYGPGPISNFPPDLQGGAYSNDRVVSWEGDRVSAQVRPLSRIERRRGTGRITTPDTGRTVGSLVMTNSLTGFWRRRRRNPDGVWGSTGSSESFSLEEGEFLASARDHKLSRARGTAAWLVIKHEISTLGN
jgi:hypothetical protein